MTRSEASTQLEKRYGGDIEPICGVKTWVEYGPDDLVTRVEGEHLSNGLRVDGQAEDLTGLGIQLRGFCRPAVYRVKELKLTVVTFECFIDRLILENDFLDNEFPPPHGPLEPSGGHR